MKKIAALVTLSLFVTLPTMAVAPPWAELPLDQPMRYEIQLDEPALTPLNEEKRPYYWTCWTQDHFGRWFGAASWWRQAAVQGSWDYCRQYNPFGGCYFMGCRAQ